MMVDLFSSLDGMTSLWSWLTPMFLSVFMIWNKTWSMDQNNIIKYLAASNWNNSTYNLTKSLLTIMMVLIIFNNLLGMAPFTYGITTSLWVNMTLALLLWGLILLSGYIKSPKKSLAHLAPSGAPLLLLPFLILIESISIMIRPLTLTVRLVANMSAGHIILALMASVLSSNLSNTSLSLSYLIMVGYYLFEFFVCFIQAYIFTLLLSLYMNEHP
uniref:ATP synthase subunit a n=1 Tax=Albinaria caerulea TaxID=42349 RepID=ATP6_ALBCA